MASVFDEHHMQDVQFRDLEGYESAEVAQVGVDGSY